MNYFGNVAANGNFETFAKACMRQFGPLGCMRDSSADAEITADVGHSTWFAEGLAKAEAEKAAMLALSFSQVRVKSIAANAARLTAEKKFLQEKKDELSAAQVVLEKANKFVAPTPKHESLATLIQGEALRAVESLQRDVEIQQDMVDGFVSKTANQWKEEELKIIEWRIERYRNEVSKEIERNAFNKSWIQQALSAVETANQAA